MSNEGVHVVFDGSVNAPIWITVSRTAEERARRTADRPYAVLMEVNKWVMLHHFVGSVLFKVVPFCSWALTKRVVIVIDARDLKHILDRNAVILRINKQDREIQIKVSLF